MIYSSSPNNSLDLQLVMFVGQAPPAMLGHHAYLTKIKKYGSCPTLSAMLAVVCFCFFKIVTYIICK